MPSLQNYMEPIPEFLEVIRKLKYFRRLILAIRRELSDQSSSIQRKAGDKKKHKYSLANKRLLYAWYADNVHTKPIMLKYKRKLEKDDYSFSNLLKYLWICAHNVSQNSFHACQANKWNYVELIKYSSSFIS